MMARWPYLHWPAEAQQLASRTKPTYFIALGISAWLFGSLTYGAQTGLAWRLISAAASDVTRGSSTTSLTTGLFLIAYLRVRRSGLHWARAHAFHTLIVVYAVAAICVAIPETLPDPGEAI
jgi:hypothetical protein